MFKEGKVYAIRNFKVAKASAQYKVVPNNLRMYFNITTSVRVVTTDSEQIPQHVFSFAPQDMLEDRVGNNTLLTGSFRLISSLLHLAVTNIRA